MPRLPRRSLATCLLLGAVLLAIPTASAALEGDIRIQLTSLDEAEIQADFVLTDEEAATLRERADHNDDGRVSALESAGVASVLVDRFQGETEAYTFDQNRYTIEQATVSTEGLEGDVDGREAGLELEAEADTDAGQAPHTFTIHGLPTDLIGDAQVVHVVQPPEGYRIAETEGFAEHEECQARTDPGTEDASLTLEAGEGFCPRGIPAPGAALVVGAMLVAVGVRMRGRQLAP